MRKEIDFLDLNNHYGGSSIFFLKFIKAFDSQFYFNKLLMNYDLWKYNIYLRSFLKLIKLFVFLKVIMI